MIFKNRQDAGRKLAQHLLGYRDRKPVVLALPRGGVPIGYEVATALDAPLDLLLVRKIGAPFQPELAIGAVIDGDRFEIFVDERIMADFDISQSYVDEEAARQRLEIERRRELYLGDRPPRAVVGCTAIVVDDGIATGATMHMALRALARRQPAAVVLAVPVVPPGAIEALQNEVDDVVCLGTPIDFPAIGAFYEDFTQVSDQEVVRLLRTRWSPKGPFDAGVRR
jgi:putative phosphoribosyl transferase